MNRPIWTFWEFQTVGGRGVITEWVEDAGLEAEEEFHGVLRNLAVSPRGLWVRPVYDVFGPDFGEITIQGQKKEHRVFGCFLPALGRYAMLIGATKKGRNYTPRDAVNSARKRFKLIERDRSQLREYTDYRF